MMEGVSGTTQHKRRRHLSTFFNWQVEQGWITMIVVACYTGLRLDELRGLRWSQIGSRRAANGRPDARYISFKAGETKSGREEEVFIPEQAWTALTMIPRKYGEHVFQPLAYFRFTSLFTEWRKAACLAPGWHTLRHTCASWMAMAGCSPLVIMKHLRHSSLKVTERYMHLAPTAHEELVSRAFG